VSGPGSVIVVGAGPGVGAAVARRFGRESHAVGLVARDRGRLVAMAANLRAAVGAALPAVRAARRGSLLFTTGSAVIRPSAERATSAVVNAARATYFTMLHDALAGDGVHVQHAVVVGPIGPAATIPTPSRRRSGAATSNDQRR
jgi:hypothetical protein